MRLYTVHLRRRADPLFTPDRDAVLVREGFNWPAFLVTWVWALVSGLWLAAGILFAIQLALGFALDLAGADSRTTLAVMLGWQMAVGFAAEDLRRWTLNLRGYALADVVAAETPAGAERRFFEHHPAMARPAWR